VDARFGDWTFTRKCFEMMSDRLVREPSDDARRAVEWMCRLEGISRAEKEAFVAEVFDGSAESPERTAYALVAHRCIRGLRLKKPSVFEEYDKRCPKSFEDILTAIHR
jgi:hypothetical protein